MTNAWAVKFDDEIKVHTVSASRRASIVIWLLEDMGQKVSPIDGDATIEKLWCGFSNGAELVEVKVEEIKRSNDEVRVPE